ncbi:OmpW family outer membrane protein [Pontixanthobacter aestiaquae]|uniref:Outer membrane beta-barrel protein n=1 Tax=Pontixanthobacter aestiaquae TaxID=1509367 RepID=A0A844Z9F5_9SPHN|nr:OmpW family outer membrane protein [Pontixanthobacter aestiaquae]MDN3646493.1 OmpW family outer membrane protein [Pontixanthobacter aestiaquae]MXO82519.1 outer membrane beta-barrel protein [Pontixanthobacter aestiaquae]
MKTRITALSTALALGAVAMVPAAASAQEAGDIQIRAFVTGVLPSDGEITDVRVDNIGVPAGSQTTVSDSVVPTIAAEYFVADNFSIETICCITPHDVNGAGALAGADIIDDAIVLPATVTAKYHFDLGGIKPYIGAGPAYFFIFSEDVGAGAAGLGITGADLSDEFGVALQAGADIDLNDSGLMFSVDAKKYFIDTTATFTDNTGILLQTEHQLDPWVVSAGLGFRF